MTKLKGKLLSGRLLGAFSMTCFVLLAMLVFAIAGRAQEPQDRGGKPPAPRLPAGAQTGAYYALVIGIDKYRAPLPNLKTAVNDARSVAQVLSARYGFEVQLLLDREATRTAILNAMSQYRRTLHANDSLLIYYAGHGHWDRDADKAYGLPSDAERDSSSNWIIADELTTDIRVQPARHMLIVSDSCYSGGLARDAGIEVKPADRQIYLDKMLAGRSRTLMSSGGNEPVADGGADGHSVFANAILDALQAAGAEAFTADSLFYNYVRPQVAGKSDQIPQYAIVRNSDHDSGDFVFVRSKTAMGRIVPAGTPGASIRPAGPLAEIPTAEADERRTPMAGDPARFARITAESRVAGMGRWEILVTAVPPDGETYYDNKVQAVLLGWGNPARTLFVANVPLTAVPNQYRALLNLDNKFGKEAVVCYTARAPGHSDSERLTSYFNVQIVDGKPVLLPAREPTLEAASDAQCGGAAVSEALRRQSEADAKAAEEREQKEAQAAEERKQKEAQAAEERRKALNIPPRINPRDGLSYVWIPPGSFELGCPPRDTNCPSVVKPGWQVNITKGFWIGQAPVTVAAWKRYRVATKAPKLPTDDGQGNGAWNEAGSDDRPTVDLTWSQAQDYCQWSGMRLPTEAQWELAARAGSREQRYGDADAIGWFAENSGKIHTGGEPRPAATLGGEDLRNVLLGGPAGDKAWAQYRYKGRDEEMTHPVAQKLPNALRLYDMLGNVMEWTATWAGPGVYAVSHGDDPTGPATGSAHVVRGNSFLDQGANIGFSSRSWLNDGADGHRDTVGFRCVGDF